MTEFVSLRLERVKQPFFRPKLAGLENASQTVAKLRDLAVIEGIGPCAIEMLSVGLKELVPVSLVVFHVREIDYQTVHALGTHPY